MTAALTRPRARWWRQALPLLAPLVATVVAYRSAAGDVAAAALVGTVAATVVALRAPRALLLVIVLLVASVLGRRPFPLAMAGVRTDLAELLLGVLLATHFLALVVQRRRPPRAGLPFVALFGSALLGALVSLARGLSRAEVVDGLKAWGWVLLVPLVASLAGRSRADRDRLAHLVTRGTAALSAFVVTTSLLLKAEFAPEQVVVTAGSAMAAQRLRPAVMALVFVAIVLVVAECLDRGFTRKRWAVLGPLLALEVLSLTRSAWVPLMLACAAVAVLRPGTRQRLAGVRRVWTAGSAVLLIGIAADQGALGGQAQVVAVRFSSVVSSQAFEERSYELRRFENEAARHALRQGPLLGLGVGATLPVTQPAGAGRVVVVEQPNIHNSYLKIWLDLGVLGILIMAWLGLLITSRAVRAARDDPQGLAEGVRVVAASAALGGLGLQAMYQTSALSRATYAAAACCVALLASESVGAADQSEGAR